MVAVVDSNLRKLALVVSASTGVALGTAFILYRAINNYFYWNGKFVDGGTVKSLYLYPIKSTKGKKVESMNCTVRGAEYFGNRDRNFLVIDAKHNNLFLTARAHPRMILLEASTIESVFYITDPTGAEPVTVSCNLIEVVQRNDVRRAKLHSKLQTDGYDCGDEIGRFLTLFLGLDGKSDVRVLYFDEKLFTERDHHTLASYWINPVPKLKDQIAYADLAAFMAFSSASIQDLNEHLELEGEKPIDERYMRPNIVIENDIPFDEDHWLHVRIGDEVEFACYKPCTRCILITVNPDEGKKHSKMEPLKILRSYRLAPQGKLLELYGKSPIFGVNMAVIRPGKIKVGDQVLIRYKKTPF